MIDIDVTIKNPERDIFSSHFSQKIKKTVKNLAKLSSKIRKVVQSREFIRSNHLNLYSNDRYSTSDCESRNIFKKILCLGMQLTYPTQIWTNLSKRRQKLRHACTKQGNFLLKKLNQGLYDRY